MLDLNGNTCLPCRNGASLASAAEVDEWLLQLPRWQVLVRDGVQRLQRNFKFKNFQQALDFTNRVGGIAEAEQHHPELITTWGSVTVSWWTHKLGGLHRNDFIMAAKTDHLPLGG